MTEWSVFGTLVAIVGFVITVVTPIIKLNTSIVKLTQIVDTMAKDLSDLTTRNAATHERIFQKLESHDHVIAEHETRIRVLENKDGNKN